MRFEISSDTDSVVSEHLLRGERNQLGNREETEQMGMKKNIIYLLTRLHSNIYILALDLSSIPNHVSKPLSETGSLLSVHFIYRLSNRNARRLYKKMFSNY